MNRYLMNIKALIFDLDGTLLNTLEDIANTLNATLAHHHFPTHSLDECRFLVGAGLRELIRKALPSEAAADDNMVDQLLNEFIEMYRTSWNQLTRPYEGIIEMLAAIAERNLPMAILSNKADHFTQQCAEELLPRPLFSVVLGHRDGMAHKPDPAGALFVAAVLGVEPTSVVYVGDSSIDMLTATRAGMYAVGVCWGFRPESELRAHGAQSLIHHPLELVTLIDTLREANA